MAVQLYPHQQKTLEETEQFNKVGYFLDMGLGKTFVGSEKMIQLNKRVNLVICQKSKVNDWVQHFEKYYNLIVYDLTDKTDFKEFVNWDGSVMADIDYYRKRVGIINYELAFRRPELLNLEHFTLMLDESSMITNPTVKRTKFIHKLKPDNCILLSGTPTGGKYEKLWSQLKLLGWNISKDLFYNIHRYCD